MGLAIEYKDHLGTFQTPDTGTGESPTSKYKLPYTMGEKFADWPE